MRPATDVIRGLRQTEKGTRIARHQQFVLDVAADATKVEIREAVKELFNVTALRVNTQIGHGKWRRLSARRGQRPDRKKAIVTVAPGQKIEVQT